MRVRRLVILVLLLSAPAAAAAQQPASSGSPAAVTAAAPAKTWVGRYDEFETFLRDAAFERFEDVPVGVTRPRRGFFDPGGLVKSAAWKVLPPGRKNGYWESYKSEVAAYELDKLLDLEMVPPTVEKRYRGERGAAILWLDGVRPWPAVEHEAKPDKWNREAVRMKMFDDLIGNIDRNAGNLLIDADWNLYLIDHSRAFVGDTKLPHQIVRIDRELWEKMAALDEPTLTAALGKWLDRGAIRAILKRRDAMQKVVDGLLKNGNEALVYVK